MESSELDYVLIQLQERKGSWPQIERETRLPYSWLSKLARGEINDPGVKKIERLGRYFRMCAKQDRERESIAGGGGTRPSEVAA